MTSRRSTVTYRLALASAFAVVLSMLAVSPASAATHQYWTGTQAENSSKSTSLVTVNGGSMWINASTYILKNRVTTQTGGVVATFASYDGSLNFTMSPTYYGVRVSCWWLRPLPEMPAPPPQRTDCDYRN